MKESVFEYWTTNCGTKVLEGNHGAGGPGVSGGNGTGRPGVSGGSGAGGPDASGVIIVLVGQV